MGKSIAKSVGKSGQVSQQINRLLWPLCLHGRLWLLRLLLLAVVAAVVPIVPVVPGLALMSV